MTRRSTANALADVSSVLVEEYDVVSALTHLCVASDDAFDAAATGLLMRTDPVRAERSDLELLAASSHRAEDLELYQQQFSQGPCLDAISTGQAVHAVDAEDMARRWPLLAAAARGSGIVAVHAFPLRWRGVVMGALNLFFAAERRLSDDERTAGQAFADVATIAIVHARAQPAVEVIAREVQEALDGRTVLEQAKGVLAVQDGVEPAEAFHRLLAHADAHRLPLAALAAEVVAGAQQGRRWDAVDR